MPDPRRAAFIREYLVDLSAKAAAIRAGYSESTAHSKAAGWLADPEVAEAVIQAMAERSRRVDITSDMVMRELAKVGFANIADYTVSTDDRKGRVIDLTAATRDQLAAVSELGDGKIKLHDKLGALDKMGRHLGMWNDKLRLGNDPDNPLPQPNDIATAARIAGILEAAQARKDDAAD